MKVWDVRFRFRLSNFGFRVAVQDLLAALEVCRQIPHKFFSALSGARAAFLGIKFDVLASREAGQVSDCHLISGFRS